MTRPPDRAKGHYALSPRHEGWVVATASALALTGILWLVGHYFLAQVDEYGASRHPLEGWALKFHGAAAMLFLVVLGTVLPVHARRAWHARLNHRTGLTVLGLALILVLTGYALYYAGSETLRPWLSLGHWAVGLAGVPLLVLHAMLGRRAAARLAAQSRARHGERHHHPRRR